MSHTGDLSIDHGKMKLYTGGMKANCYLIAPDLILKSRRKLAMRMHIDY
jgi:hypothetical protein